MVKATKDSKPTAGKEPGKPKSPMKEKKSHGVDQGESSKTKKKSQKVDYGSLAKEAIPVKKTTMESNADTIGQEVQILSEPETPVPNPKAKVNSGLTGVDLTEFFKSPVLEDSDSDESVGPSKIDAGVGSDPIEITESSTNTDPPTESTSMTEGGKVSSVLLYLVVQCAHFASVKQSDEAFGKAET